MPNEMYESQAGRKRLATGEVVRAMDLFSFSRVTNLSLRNLGQNQIQNPQETPQEQREVHLQKTQSHHMEKPRKQRTSALLSHTPPEPDSNISKPKCCVITSLWHFLSLFARRARSPKQLFSYSSPPVERRGPLLPGSFGPTVATPRV